MQAQTNSQQQTSRVTNPNLTLTVVIPCFNEINTIAEIIERVRTNALVNEIIIVDDGSTDGTREYLQKLESEKPEAIKIFYHTQNQGKGAALVTGFSHASCDVVVIQDADLEYDPREYSVLLKPMQEGIATVVYGSRFLGGPRKAMNFWNMIANRSLTLFTNVLYNAILSDMETCYKAFRTEVMRDMVLRSRGFNFEPEFTAKVLKQGIRIYEVPISYNGREWSEGKKIKWTAAPMALWTLFKYRFVN